MDRPLKRALMAGLVAALAATVSLAGLTGGSASALARTTTAAVPSGGGMSSYGPLHPYTPRFGAIFNDPYSRTRKQVILNHIINTIDSVRVGGLVQVSDWNIDNQHFVNRAIAAHKRGVTVQIIMSRGVAKRQNPNNGSFAQLQRQLAVRYPQFPTDKSFAYACASSCRGTTGIMHAKVVLVSSSGTASDIVMVSSANMTGIAGVNQWNDIFTVPGNQDLYQKFQDIFAAERNDRIDHPMYQTYGAPPIEAFFNPHKFHDKDPVITDLNAVKCSNPGPGAGINGHTAIRIAQTAISGDRGIAIGDKLASLAHQGCNIKVVFTLIGNNVRKALVAAHIPNRQLVRDTNHDGYYDKYLHTKLMTISGNFRGKQSMHMVRNGSENWNPTAFQSDEAGLQLFYAPTERNYTQHIDALFNKGSLTLVPKAPSTRGLDPYRFVELN